MIKKLALIGFTDNAKDRIAEIKSELPQDTEFLEYHKGDDLKTFVGKAFSDCDCLLFVSAMGIAVRSVAPYIRSKDKDPAVIVMDELGHNVIPVLSGHIGGANEFALELSRITGADPVITTGTDVNGKFAVDTWAVKNGFEISDISKIKTISSAVIRGDKVGLFIEASAEVSGEIPEELTLIKEGEAAPEIGIYVGVRTDSSPFRETLYIYPKALFLGAGCRKDLDPHIFGETVRKLMSDQGILIKAVSDLATVDIKKEEPCMKMFCAEEGIGMITFTGEELMEEEGDFSSSDFVKSVTGADNVSERAAFRAARLAGGEPPHTVMKRTALNGLTLSVCEKKWECRFDV